MESEAPESRRILAMSSSIFRNIRRLFPILFSFGILSFCLQCTPYYTWGYAPTVRPEATTAYIHAVMARERGDCRLALEYYDRALSLTWSDSVAAERDEAETCLRQ